MRLRRRMMRVVACAVAAACAGDVAQPVGSASPAFDGRAWTEAVHRLHGAVAEEPAVAALARLIDASVDAPAPEAAVPFPGLPDTLFVGSFHHVLGRTFARDGSADRYSVQRGRSEAPGDGVAFVLYEPRSEAGPSSESGVFVASGLRSGPALVFDWDHLISRIDPGDWALGVVRDGRTLMRFDYDEAFDGHRGEFGNLRTHQGLIGDDDAAVGFVLRRFRPAPAAEGSAAAPTYTLSLSAPDADFRVSVEGVVRGADPLPPSSIEATALGAVVKMERLDDCSEAACTAVWRRFAVTVNGTLLGRASRSATGEFGVTVAGPDPRIDDPGVPITAVLRADQLIALSDLQALSAEVPILYDALRGAVGMLLRLVVSCDPGTPQVCAAEAIARDAPPAISP